MSLSAKRLAVLLTMDVLIVAELTYAFWRCAASQGDFSETFLSSYVPLFVPTIVISFFFLRRIKRREAALADTLDTPKAVFE